MYFSKFLFTFIDICDIMKLVRYLIDKLEFREVKEMVEIRYVQSEDKEFWYSLDRHLPEKEFNNKISFSKISLFIVLMSTKPNI